jgi:hypothetical protein
LGYSKPKEPDALASGVKNLSPIETDALASGMKDLNQ